jgi:hypothetical protein
MDLFFELSSLFKPKQTELRKLQPAVYLAQRLSGYAVCRYRLWHGRVVSNELGEAVDQLESCGLLLTVCDVATRSKVVVGLWELKTAQAEVQTEVRNLREVLSSLLDEDAGVLNAAATARFFHEEGLGKPETNLRWYRALPDEVRERASQLAGVD